MQHWDVSRVTKMSGVFDMYFDLKQHYCNIHDISGWDVSQVTNFVSNPLTCEEPNLI